jgi:hypothetical protein
MHPHVRTLILLPLLALTRSLHAQAPPQVLHTQITTLSAATGLEKQIETARRGTQPVWIGYAIPLVPGMQLDTSTLGTLDLNHEGSSYTRSNPTPPDTPSHGVLLFHLDHGIIERIRLVDPARILDAGDQPFTWLTNVSTAESIRLLTSLAQTKSETTRGSRERSINHAALFAISAHNSPEATTALIELTAPSNPLDLREQAAFWLANQRGHEGFLAVQKAARTDPDPDFRKKLTFDLTLTKDPEALDELIRMAHSDTSPEVRKQAQFWMANKGGRKVADDLHGIASDDPNAEVRKSAVFAISRLPGDESTTRLIDLVKTSKDPAVRKQAVFWLGQSRDPHALDYLTSLIRQ